MRITAMDLVSAISSLPRDRIYHYIKPSTKTVVQIGNITQPQGPIYIKRHDPSKGETPTDAKEETISVQMLWRVANAITSGIPLNIDRVLGASYNTRSVLETLLAHTPQFYVCYPGRVESMNARSTVEHGHKHLMWKPNEPHEIGVITQTKTEIVISEMPTQEVIYDAIVLPDQVEQGLDINIQRRHAQMQIALVRIGKQLNYRTHVAQNDLGIKYQSKSLAEMEGVITSMAEKTLISSWDEAVKAAKLIDCIWFKNGKLMPAVIEVEYSTGIKSGLTRMQQLHDVMPPFPTRYVIVASDEDRNKAVDCINMQQYRPLNARYFPYSAVEELWNLCEKRNLRGVTEEFLDNFMEPVLEN